MQVGADSFASTVQPHPRRRGFEADGFGSIGEWQAFQRRQHEECSVDCSESLKRMRELARWALRDRFTVVTSNHGNTDPCTGRTARRLRQSSKNAAAAMSVMQVEEKGKCGAVVATSARP